MQFPYNNASIHTSPESFPDMTRMIALEASSEVCSVAVLDNETVYFQQSDQPRSHASALLPMLDVLLVRAGLSLSSMDALAVTHGPGSFTGIRISMAVAQGLAYGAGLPVVPVSTLELLANQTLLRTDAQHSHYILPLIDARMNEVYWTAYRVDGERIEEVKKPAVTSIEYINQEFTQLADEAPLVGVGNGWTLTGVNRSSLAECHSDQIPNARDLVLLGNKLLQQRAVRKIQDVHPLYLRNEVSWNKRTRIRKTSS